MSGIVITDEIAAAFQDGFTNGNAVWDETPDYHKDMFREGARCGLEAALALVPLPPEGGKEAGEPVAWTHQVQIQRLKDAPRESSSMWSEPNKTINIPLYTSPIPVRATEVQIKSLEWGPYHNPVFAGPDVAVAWIEPFGVMRYQAQRDAWDDGFIVNLAPEYEATFWETKGHATLEAAKAAAQADYEQRILSALSPIPARDTARAEEIGTIVSRIYDETRATDGLGALLDRGSGAAIMVAMRRAVEAALAAPVPAARAEGLKHPLYAHGISTEQLIVEALAFCDEELDGFSGMEYDSDSEVCCQRSNTFIRELVERLESKGEPRFQVQQLPWAKASDGDFWRAEAIGHVYEIHDDEMADYKKRQCQFDFECRIRSVLEIPETGTGNVLPAYWVRVNSSGKATFWENPVPDAEPLYRQARAALTAPVRAAEVKP